MFATVLAVSALGATAFTQQASDSFKFVAIGDTPYSLPADYPRFERLISSINAAKPSFTVHAGDIKSGSSECSDANILKIRDYFNTFENPLIYAVGDNEWTDCHREKAGKFDPLERLGKLREWFLAKPKASAKPRWRLSVKLMFLTSSKWLKMPECHAARGVWRKANSGRGSAG